MALQAVNNIPKLILPTHVPSPKGDMDLSTEINAVFVEPVRTSPITPGTDVDILDDGAPVDDDTIIENIVRACGDVVDADAEEFVDDYFAQTWLAYTKGALPVREAFLNAAATRKKLPAPTPNIIYSASSDVIPAARGLIAQTSDFDTWCASLGLFARAETLGVSMLTSDVYAEFKQYFQTMVGNLGSVVSPDVVNLVGKFAQTTLYKELVCSLNLRTDDADGNDPYSFPRLLTWAVHSFVKTKNDERTCGIIPFDIAELICPRSIVFINVDTHAHARPNRVMRTWTEINDALKSPVRIVSNKALVSVTASIRNQKKLAAAAAAASRMNKGVERTAAVPFSKRPVDIVDATKRIKRISAAMGAVNKSENAYKVIVNTFARPNRRDPDDWNLSGRAQSTRYKPDLHLYVDTSGSISQENYEDAVKAAILIARSLNVNLYFNSFSHVLSECTHVQTKDSSAAQIYKRIERIPKVAGGTDFSMVWDYIEASKKRSRELSLIITDFDYRPPVRTKSHPANLYYLPCSKMDWRYVVRTAEKFTKACQRFAPDIRRHLLF